MSQNTGVVLLKFHSRFAQSILIVYQVTLPDNIKRLNLEYIIFNFINIILYKFNDILMTTKLPLLIVCFINLFSPGGGTCRAVSGSSNYCDFSNCYLYSNSSGQELTWH